MKQKHICVWLSKHRSNFVNGKVARLRSAVRVLSRLTLSLIHGLSSHLLAARLHPSLLHPNSPAPISHLSVSDPSQSTTAILSMSLRDMKTNLNTRKVYLLGNHYCQKVSEGLVQEKWPVAVGERGRGGVQAHFLLCVSFRSV